MTPPNQLSLWVTCRHAMQAVPGSPRWGTRSTAQPVHRTGGNTRQYVCVTMPLNQTVCVVLVLYESSRSDVATALCQPWCHPHTLASAPGSCRAISTRERMPHAVGHAVSRQDHAHPDARVDQHMIPRPAGSGSHCSSTGSTWYAVNTAAVLS